MFLKSIQIIGFKSFADKTTVNFHPGVTAIVGPNGCGKSNVLDALKWVLGEQSAKALRGGAMHDVIFGGSDLRKPLGMAEVSLTFGDCEAELGTEYNEVTVTRRIFRDGVSEYELNKTPCRLRDIYALFMDTGIGRSAYSIMEQGKIDQILSSHPDDRRAVFEEAAGITKYKTQRKEALRKLEHTEANLLRLTDIIAEVKRQIGSLQRQAGKARRYRELLEELRGMETQLARRDFDAFSASINAAQNHVDQSRARHDELTATVETQESALSELRGQLEAAETALQEKRDQLYRSQSTVLRAEQRRSRNEARIAEFCELRERCRLELSSCEEKIRIQEDHLRSLDAELEAGQLRLTEMEGSFHEKELLLSEISGERDTLDSQQAEYADNIRRAEQTLQRLRNDLAAVELQQRNFVFRIDNLRAEQSALEIRHAEAESLRAAQALELARAEEQLAATRSQVETLQAEAQEKAAGVREFENAFQQAERDHQSLVARCETLRELVYQPQLIPAAAASLPDSVSLLGRLSERIEILPGYELPIAVLIGDAVDALLVEDAAAAHNLAEALHARGESGLIAPLNAARTPWITVDAPTSALQYVRMAENVQPLVAALLDRCHIVEDLAAAETLKTSHPDALIATRRGEFLGAAGLIRVGQQQSAIVDLFARRNEIRVVEEKLAPAALARENAADALARSRNAQQNAREGLEQSRQETQKAEIETARLKHTQSTLSAQAGDIAGQIGKIQREIQALAQQDAADREKQTLLQETVRTEEAELEENRSHIASLDARREELGEREETARQALTEQRILLLTQKQQTENQRHQREQSGTRLQELQELHGTRSRESADYDERIEQAQAEIALADEEKAAAETQVSSDQAVLEEAEQGKRTHLFQIEEHEGILRSERRNLAELQNERAAWEIQLAEKKLHLGSLRDRVQRLYQLNLEDLAPLEVGETPIDWPVIEAEAGEKRSRLDAMGPVNLEAISEYDELEQRHTFLNTQQEDLLNAKQQLLEAIHQINHTTRQLFAETFEKIKANFQEMFVELFGGGKATLNLLDAEDPLESGIEIVARPPGKQPQSITLLSGGEKTMTAVALLFSIYMVKPSPFCVLDEMDAPLDESNINRFIKILKRFTEHSQFVVITHNKRTISVADVLYGVTMEERGVSKIVSVRLNRNEEATRNGNHEKVPSIAESFGRTEEALA